MRFLATIPTAYALAFSFSCFPASAVDRKVVDPQAVAALAGKAEQAQPKEQCFLYAELVSQMTELASQQLDTGDELHASASLKMVQYYAEKIHLGLASDAKKMKNAEQLMQHTSHRLNDIIGAASYEDRQALHATLKQLDRVQTELMMQVFKK